MRKLTEREERLVRRTFLDYQQTQDFIQYPLIMDRAEGLYCWDRDGKRYFDAIGGIYVATLGHRHPRVVEAVRAQMAKLTFVAPMHCISDVALDFVEKVGSVTPGNLNYVKAFCGGSESVESAIKFVRQYFRQTGRPGKFKTISRYSSYHGATLATMAASGTGKRKMKYEPLPGGFLKVFPPNYYRDRFDSWEECNRFCAQMFEDVIVNEGPESVAAVLVEPIGNTGGIITPTEEYFRIIRDICDRHDVMLIFDEVITGFGKTGAMFAAQAYGVTPDLICSGKGLGSGVVPIGAMIARDDMGDAFLGADDDEVHFAHGHTFSNNPLACAAGIAVIDEIVEKELDKKALVLGRRLEARLEGLKRYGVVRETRGKGILRGVELVKNTETMAPFPELGKALKRTAIENGLIMRISTSWFAVSPPLIAEESDIDEMCDLIEKSLRDALKAVGW
ncbi:MAG: aspartate aminotransferase family protein [Planctomycetes bacterium]|nr:aspartate aminotransferase family protein [Planctomycetota bacterium]